MGRISRYCAVLLLGAVSFVASGQSSVEPIVDPVPQTIAKGDIRVVAEPFLRFPRSNDSSNPPSTNSAWARLQYMYPVPDDSGRLAINDLRGLLYFTDHDGAEPVVYLDVRDYDIGFDDSMFPNETGLAGFAFHPPVRPTRYAWFWQVLHSL